MINNIEQLILIIRPMIAKQAEISIDDVINADSIRGPELTKIVDGKKEPYQPHEQVIIFELNETSDVSVYETQENDEINAILSYELAIVLYGDAARTHAVKLKGRLLSEKVLQELSEQGISITSISNIIPSSEFINSTRYIRRDFSINFNTTININQIENYEHIDIAKVTIKKE